MTQAFVLVGGLGTRLRPITKSIPKPMVDVNGKPFLERLVLMLKTHGMDNFIFGVGYLRDQIEAHFGLGSSLGVTISYSQEETPMGTGGALFVTGAVLYFVGKGMADDLAKDIKAYNKSIPRSTAAYDDIQSRRKSLGTLNGVTIASGVVGAAGLGIGLWLYLTGDDPGKYDAQSTVTVGFGGQGAWVVGLKRPF